MPSADTTPEVCARCGSGFTRSEDYHIERDEWGRLQIVHARRC